MKVKDFWCVILNQQEKEIRLYFHPDAQIRWHNTNESFTVDEFIRANCEYPGNWDGTVERIVNISDELIITVTHVYSKEDKTVSFHVVSFICLKDDKIIAMDEYWGDDGQPPQWRLEKHLGKPIY